MGFLVKWVVRYEYTGRNTYGPGPSCEQVGSSGNGNVADIQKLSGSNLDYDIDVSDRIYVVESLRQKAGQSFLKLVVYCSLSYRQ
jgi:hypothetical protein